MSDQIDPEKRGSQYSEYVLALLCVAVIACAFGLIWAPQLSLLFFIFIVVCVLAAVLLYRGASYPVSPRKKLSKSVNLESRNTAAYRSIAEAMQHPAYIIDRGAIVRYSNKSATDTFGSIRENEWVFVKFRNPLLRKSIEEGIKENGVVKQDYNDAVPKDRWFSMELAPIHSSYESTLDRDAVFLLIFQDLTEVKRIDQMRSDFIANASHELRTPLASLLGYLETIKGPASKDKAAVERFTDIMLEQAQRMTRLVNDLLSLSRIEMKAHDKPSDSVNLTKVLQGVVASLEGLAKQLGVTLELKCDKGIFVTGDRDELLQVFENLIENSCKYGQDGKKVIVNIALEKSDNETFAEVSVQDFGPGIAIEHQQRITERFYRVDVERSREKQGTGLGLAIVKHILNRHGTRLKLVSQPGEGTVFSVRLPVKNKKKPAKSNK